MPTMAEGDLPANAMSNLQMKTNANTEIGATNSIGQLLTEAAANENTDFEPNGSFHIADLAYDTATGTIQVDLNAADFCHLLVCFYNDDGTEMLTSATKEIEPGVDVAELQIDASLLEASFLIKAYLLDDLQFPLTEVYVCNTYTKVMQEILTATTADFDEEYIINLDADTTTNFLVLTEDTKILTTSETENTLISADYENGIYQFENPDNMLAGLQQGDFFYFQNQQELIVDKVSHIEIQDNVCTVTSEDTDIQEAFEFVKIEEDSRDFDIPEMKDTSEHAELIRYGKEEAEQDVTPVSEEVRPLTGAKMHEESLWDHFSFEYNLVNNEILSKENSDKTQSEKLELKGTLKFMMDPHINCYWSLLHKYFEIRFEVLTETDFAITLNGSYEGTVAKFHEIAFGGTGIYFKLRPELQVEAKANLDISFHSEETFGFHYDTDNGMRSLHQEPVVTSKDPNFKGKIGVYLNFQPKLVVITEKAANLSFMAKIGIVLTAETDLKDGGILDADTKEIHECDSCIYGKIYFSVKLGWEGKLFNGKLKVGDMKNLVLDKKIPILDYYISSFGDLGFTKCPHHKYRIRFLIYDEHLSRVENAAIHLTIKPEDYANEYAVFYKISPDLLQLDETLTTDENGIAETWFTKSMESTIPIRATVSYDGYEEKITDFQFKGKAKKLTFHLYPVDYVGEKVRDAIETLLAITDVLDPDSTTETTTAVTEATTETTTMPVSHNIIASGVCGADGDNVTWTLDDEGTLTISGTGDMADYGYGFQPWKPYRDNMISVNIDEGVTAIGDHAFESFKSLTSITIPDGLTAIGDAAFAYCTSLTSIIISDGVTAIGDNGITAIGDSAFAYCTNLTSIIIPDGVTAIGDHAFESCESLTSITIPDGVTAMGWEAFFYCTNLTSITIPDGVTAIEESAFLGCENLTSITIPDGVTAIGNGAFLGCENLTSITIPNGVTTIEDYAFESCESLTSITIPDGVTAIMDRAFSGCESLTDVYYNGTEEEWHAIRIGSDNAELTSAAIHCESAAPNMVSLSLSNLKTASVPMNLQTYTYTDAAPNTSYLLLAVNDAASDSILAEDNLYYVDQQTADENGSVTFHYTAPDACTYIFIGDFGKGKYCRIIDDFISTDTENCTICVSQTPDNPGSETTTPPTMTTTTETTTTTTTSTTPPTTDSTGHELPTLVGDADLSGRVDSQDAFIVLMYASYMALGETDHMLYPDDAQINSSLMDLCDIDHNQAVDTTDAFWILMYSSYRALGIEITWEEVMH